MTCAFVGDEEKIRQVFGSERLELISKRVQLLPFIVPSDRISAHVDSLRETEVIISTWGMPIFTEDQLDQLPDLRLVLYAAGDVRYFAPPLVRREIQIVSAWRANAVPVAEFTLAQILLAGKGYFQNVRQHHDQRDRSRCFVGKGNCGATVSILGAGAIGRLLIERLRLFDFSVLVFDPFLSDVEATHVGVTKVSLEEAFSQGNVVSNHVPNNRFTQGMITGNLLATMPEGATFINTGRGATVDQEGFISAFRARPDLTALLDVTDPEPLPRNSPIWDMANVCVSTHIAGAIGNEFGRMADICMADLERYMANDPLENLVPAPALEL